MSGATYTTDPVELTLYYDPMNLQVYPGDKFRLVYDVTPLSVVSDDAKSPVSVFDWIAEFKRLVRERWLGSPSFKLEQLSGHLPTFSTHIDKVAIDIEITRTGMLFDFLPGDTYETDHSGDVLLRLGQSIPYTGDRLPMYGGLTEGATEALGDVGEVVGGGVSAVTSGFWKTLTPGSRLLLITVVIVAALFVLGPYVRRSST